MVPFMNKEIAIIDFGVGTKERTQEVQRFLEAAGRKVHWYAYCGDEFDMDQEIEDLTPHYPGVLIIGAKK